MRNLPLTLTVVSAVPFVGLSLAVSAQMFENNSVAIHTLLTYSTIILSFLGGIHWGVAVTSYSHNRKIANLLISESVFPSIIAWGAIFHAELHIQLLVLTVLFTFVWAIDSVLSGRNIIPAWFFEIRCIITPVVVVSLYIAYFGMI